MVMKTSYMLGMSINFIYVLILGDFCTSDDFKELGQFKNLPIMSRKIASQNIHLVEDRRNSVIERKTLYGKLYITRKLQNLNQKQISTIPNNS